MSKGCVELLLGLQLSSAEKLIPCSGASGPTSPDQTNIFIMRFEGEANDARHKPALPSAVGASAVNCDCKRKGRRSGAHSLAAKNIFWKAVRPVSNCASLAAGLAAGWEAGWESAFFSGEHDTSSASATHPISFLYIVYHSSGIRDFASVRLLLVTTASPTEMCSRRHDWRQASLPGTLVDLGVLLCCGGPGVVLKHAVAHQPLPLLVVAVSCHRRFYGVQQRLAIGFLELESRSLAGCGVVLLNRVVESAGGADDGHCAVLEAVELVLACRFVLRRHKEHVGASFDLVSKTITEFDLHREFLGILLVEAAEQVLVLAVAGPQGNDDEFLARQAVGDLLDEIKALLSSEARHDAYNRQLGPRGEAKLLEQVLLAFWLAGQVIGRVVRGNHRVRGRIPLGVVHAIQDAHERGPPRPQHPFQSKTIFGSLNLLRILTAHRGEVVGGINGPLEEVDLAVELQLGHAEQVPRQHQQRQNFGGKQSLIAEVVDREHAVGM